MKKYEFVFLTRSGLKKSKLEKIFLALREEIKKAKGKIEKEENLGKKDLAFPINKETQASFWVWRLILKDKVSFSSINIFLNREPEIIRYLFLRERKRRR